jgi:hypothetical protein
MDKIEFTPAKLKLLKQEYEKAKNKESFIFEGREILTSYAKYLIQYLESQIGDVNTESINQ